MLKIAMLSSWHVHAMEYAQRFSERKDAVVTCVWDEEPTKGEAFAKELGVPFVADIDEILARVDVDAVCISAPTNIHEMLMIKAANAKKHIFTEKVLALTLAECERIKEAIEKNNVKFTICFFQQALSHNLFAKQVLDEQLLGQVTYCRIRNAHSGASDGWLPPHFYDLTQCGGGAMIDLGAHPMYLIHWLMGMPDEMASTFTYVTGKEVEDNAVSTMKYKDGRIVISETGFVSSPSPFILEIYGTQGALMISGTDVRNKMNISLSSKKILDGTYAGFIQPDQLPTPDAHPVDDFVEGVLNGSAMKYGIDDAIALTRLMVAAYHAHEAGGFVKV